MRSWSCKVGEIDASKLPKGADEPMREAIAKAYREITGEDAKFIFSGWGGIISEAERAVVEDREPFYPIEVRSPVPPPSYVEGFDPSKHERG